MKPNLADLVLALYPYGYKEPKSPTVQLAMEMAEREATIFKRVENLTGDSESGWSIP